MIQEILMYSTVFIAIAHFFTNTLANQRKIVIQIVIANQHTLFTCIIYRLFVFVFFDS